MSFTFRIDAFFTMPFTASDAHDCRCECYVSGTALVRNPFRLDSVFPEGMMPDTAAALGGLARLDPVSDVGGKAFADTIRPAALLAAVQSFGAARPR